MINARSIFHININCTDLERSLAFYKLIGFREVINFDERDDSQPDGFGQGPGLHGPAFRLPASAKVRGRLLALGDRASSTRLDLLQWLEPKTAGTAYPDLAHVGMARICFSVDDAWAAHKTLADAGTEILSEPTLIEVGDYKQLFFCAYDPDRVVVEFMQFLKD